MSSICPLKTCWSHHAWQPHCLVTTEDVDETEHFFPSKSNKETVLCSKNYTFFYDLFVCIFPPVLITHFPSCCRSSPQTIRGAGHYVYADQPDDFNHRVLQVCDKVDWSGDDLGYWTVEKKGSTNNRRDFSRCGNTGFHSLKAGVRSDCT